MEAAAPRFLVFASAALARSGIHLRAALPVDLPWLAVVYASTRSDELRQVPWSAEQKIAFTDWQSARQEEHYAQHYPNAERLVIERARTDPADERRAIGRIYLETTAAEVRLMDITLLPADRNRGTGTRIMDEMLRYADALQRRMSLHVEPFNPARRMYERMDFAVSETRGLYEFMVRAARRR